MTWKTVAYKLGMGTSSSIFHIDTKWAIFLSDATSLSYMGIVLQMNHNAILLLLI